MTPKELQKHSRMIDDSVSWLEKRADDVWFRYEEIDDCSTQECEKEKSSLRSELNRYLNKLQDEEKMIDKYEEILHNKTGIK